MIFRRKDCGHFLCNGSSSVSVIVTVRPHPRLIFTGRGEFFIFLLHSALSLCVLSHSALCFFSLALSAFSLLALAVFFLSSFFCLSTLSSLTTVKLLEPR